MTEPEFPDTEVEDERAARLHNALAMEELVSANQASNATMIGLIETVHKETAARDRKVAQLESNTKQLRKFTLVAMVMCALLLCMAVFNATNVIATRNNAEKTANIADDVKNTNTLLLDCLNSQGECGKWNAEQQRRTLEEIKKYELTGFYCIRNNPGPTDPDGEKFLACVNRLYPGGPQLNAKLN